MSKGKYLKNLNSTNLNFEKEKQLKFFKENN